MNFSVCHIANFKILHALKSSSSQYKKQNNKKKHLPHIDYIEQSNLKSVK